MPKSISSLAYEEAYSLVLTEAYFAVLRILNVKIAKRFDMIGSILFFSIIIIPPYLLLTNELFFGAGPFILIILIICLRTIIFGIESVREKHENIDIARSMYRAFCADKASVKITKYRQSLINALFFVRGKLETQEEKYTAALKALDKRIAKLSSDFSLESKYAAATGEEVKYDLPKPPDFKSSDTANFVYEKSIKGFEFRLGFFKTILMIIVILVLAYAHYGFRDLKKSATVFVSSGDKERQTIQTEE